MAEKIISITKARQKLFKIAQELQKPDVFYILTIDGRPKVVLMSVNEFKNLHQAVDILSLPGAIEQIKQGQQEADMQDYVYLNNIKSIILNDKGNNKYENKKSKENKK